MIDFVDEYMIVPRLLDLSLCRGKFSLRAIDSSGNAGIVDSHGNPGTDSRKSRMCRSRGNRPGWSIWTQGVGSLAMWSAASTTPAAMLSPAPSAPNAGGSAGPVENPALAGWRGFSYGNHNMLSEPTFSLVTIDHIRYSTHIHTLRDDDDA